MVVVDRVFEIVWLEIIWNRVRIYFRRESRDFKRMDNFE